VGYRAFINQGREMWDQRGLDTLVVASVNSAGSGLVMALFFDLISTFSSYRETKAFVFRGEYIRKAET
jgi:hypothetical protein